MLVAREEDCEFVRCLAMESESRGPRGGVGGQREKGFSFVFRDE